MSVLKDKMPDKDKDHVQNLLVAVRVRPMNATEIDTECTEIAHVLDDNLVVLQDPYEDQDDVLRANRSREKQYVFDIAFGPNASQADVYVQTSKVLVEKVTTGYNATVFAYGATGAGKTYTMLGTDKMPGIMGLALNDLFNEMERTRDEITYKVSMSYLEIYNEMIRDLLNPSSGYLELREDAKGVVVAGISEVEAKTTTEVMGMLMMGNKQRTCEPTAANMTSSRSHAVLQVTVKQKSKVKNIMQEIRIGKLFMIDLAGSERAAQTKNRGKRMIEGAHINRSLLALGNCINALCENRGQYVNFRDSKLTRLLKDSLGGNSCTVMIAHVSPASQAFEESRNTLLYADRAKNIKNKVRCNQVNVSYHIAQYTSIIADLRKEIFRLKMKIEEHEMEDSKKGSNQIAENQGEMVKLRDQLVNTFQEQMDIRRKLMALENETMQITVDTNRYMMVIDEWEQEKMRRLAKSRQVARDRQRLKPDLNTEGEKRADSQQEESHSGRQKKGSPLERNDDSYSRKTSAKYVKELMNREEKEREKLEHGKVESLTKSESFEDIESKDLDTEKDLKSKTKNGKEDFGKYCDDTDSETFIEPEEVSFARDEINNLIAEEKRTAQQKTDLQSKLMQTRKEVEHLEELLPQKISTEDHREILGLLCRIHELEITNAEFQSQALLSDNFLRQKELTISKYDSKQRICDEIIQMQKALINEHDIETPLELQTLYNIYSQQALESDSHTTTAESVELVTNEPATSRQKVSVLANLNRKMVVSQENDYSFSKLSPLTEESPSRLMSLQNSPVKKTRLSPTSQDLFPRNHRIVDSPRIPFGRLSPKQRIGNLTPDVLSLNSALPSPVVGATNDGKSSAESTQQDTADVPIFSKTKKIADIAAKRRAFMDKSVNSSRSSLRPDTDSRTSESGMGSNSDTSLVQNQNTINAKATFKSSLSLSDLSMLERKGGDASSEESFGSVRKISNKRKTTNDGKKGNRTGKTSCKTRLRSASLSDSRNVKVKPRMTRKEELQEAARQSRLSSSQSVLKTHDRGNMGTYAKTSVVSRRKTQAHSKLHSIKAGDSSGRWEKTVPKSRLPVLHGDRPNTRIAQADREDTRKVQNSRRIQQTENVEDTSELIHFFSNSTPPSTVHQHGAPFGKGHTIQKRYRRPQDTLGAESSHSTPRLKPRKNVGSFPPKSGNAKNELLINGHAVKPSRHYAGTRRA